MDKDNNHVRIAIIVLCVSIVIFLVWFLMMHIIITLTSQPPVLPSPYDVRDYELEQIARRLEEKWNNRNNP
jgi:hypothetical protein